MNLRIAKEWKFQIRLLNLKCSVDLRSFNTLAAAMVGWKAVERYEMPITGAALFGVAASVIIGADFGLQRIRPLQGPYRYVSQYHQELF